MGMYRLYTDEPRQRWIGDIVDDVMATMQRNDRAQAAAARPSTAEPRWSGEWPKGGLAEGSFGTQTNEPFWSHGNYAAPGWSAGRRVALGELLRPEDYAVKPVDDYDAEAARHDFDLDAALRAMYQALAEGRPQSEALAALQRSYATADRRLADAAERSSASTVWGGLFKAWTTPVLTWSAVARDTVADRLRDDAGYRRFVDSLTPRELLGLTTWSGALNEPNRLGQRDAELELARRFPDLNGVPWNGP
jgi:hypothetical protein